MDATLKRWRGERNRRRGVVRRLRARAAKENGRIKRLNKAIARRVFKLSGTAGDKVIDAAGRMLGKVETGDNDAPWLRQMEADLVAAGSSLGWMIPGQPYCGLGVAWSVLEGLGFLLPDGIVYTPNICGYNGMIRAGRGGQRYRLKRVAPEQAKPGAIVVFDWAPGSGADHTGLARGPMRGGVIPTREFNTSPGNFGSQSNGGGVFDRLRYRANVLCVLNVEPA